MYLIWLLFICIFKGWRYMSQECIWLTFSILYLSHVVNEYCRYNRIVNNDRYLREHYEDRRMK